MKRTPLQRRTRLERRTRLRARRPTERRSARVYDEPRRRWTRRQPCCARKLRGHTCDGRVHPHHTGGHGASQKPDDDLVIALCALAHQHAHSLAGCFRGWTRADVVEWEEREVAEHRTAYERHRAREERSR